MPGSLKGSTRSVLEGLAALSDRYVLGAEQRELQIDHLPHVQMQVRRTTQKDVEPVGGIFLAHGGVGARPVVFGLSPHRPRHHGYGFGEPRYYERFCGMCRIAELPLAVRHVAGAGNLGSDGVAQISREMQHQVSETVPERGRLSPELFRAQGPRQFLDAGPQFLIPVGKPRSNSTVQQVSSIYLWASVVLL